VSLEPSHTATRGDPPRATGGTAHGHSLMMAMRAPMMGLLLAMLTGLCTAQQPPVPPGVNSSNCRGCLDPVAGICILNLDAQHGSGDCALVGPQDCAANGLIWVNNTINAYPAGDGCLAIPEAMGNNCSYLIGPLSCVFGQCVAPSRAQSRPVAPSLAAATHATAVCGLCRCLLSRLAYVTSS
jgi:hypothetical protein